MFITVKLSPKDSYLAMKSAVTPDISYIEALDLMKEDDDRSLKN